MRTRVMFLTWESPWPANSGGNLRTLGLLKEIGKAHEVELVVLSRRPLSGEQTRVLLNHVSSIVRVPMRKVTLRDKLRVVARMAKHLMPYHCAILTVSFQERADVLEKLRSFRGIVYASYGHWGTLVHKQKAPNWILDQHNADVDFWRVYATQASSWWAKLAALLNWRLAARHFPKIYVRVGRVVSVCEEDKRLTLALAPHAQVDVIENGVDCSYCVPDRTPRMEPPRILFTGTSAPRNMTALGRFVRDVFPLIQQKIPNVELLVGGDFGNRAQARFSSHTSIGFTGRVDDMRPVFNRSDVLVAPFEETHGSKLKIAEAMAMGMAIVSTPAGVRGFPLVDGESVLIAHIAGQFAEYTVALLSDPVQREDLGAAARAVALTSIDWAVLGKCLREIIESVQGCHE